MNFNPVELIIKKKTGKELTKEELEYFINSYINNEIPEYQMSALLMAIYFQNMKIEEVQTLTRIYIESGKQITFPKSYKTVDKHSTGGVGDKITIMLAPIVAACGGKIPMISGRGLGHTGGTLDKLESIPGFRTNFNDTEFKKIIEDVGFCIISQSEELVPADRRIYALRDVSGTVESLPLITASIMSKKIAEGAQNLVVDLKIGTGAFIKDLDTGRELANLLIKTGEKFGQKVSVVFSNMNSPLGEYIGNALEIKETIEYLQGKDIEDIDKLTKTLAIEMLLLSEIATTEAEAMNLIEDAITTGRALDYFRNSIAAQGGNSDVCDDLSLLPQAKYKIPIVSQKTGWIKSINSQQIGYALIEIGAGRRTLDSQLDYSSGAHLIKKIGDKITGNETIGHVFCNDKDEGVNIITKILNSYELIDEKVQKESIILDLIK
ncbi:MAG: thymidine phosphorylase [Candidatus Tenebribacter mawsonii]|nr:thymidine phosphorylase [Candidatus Tenebribacter mawsonii]